MSDDYNKDARDSDFELGPRLRDQVFPDLCMIFHQYLGFSTNFKSTQLQRQIISCRRCAPRK